MFVMHNDRKAIMVRNVCKLLRKRTLPKWRRFFSCDIAAISTHIVQSFAFAAAVAAKRAS